jgi:hypothetical protein
MRTLLGVMALWALAATARADGDETLGATLFESGRGYGLATIGVGVAGRRAPPGASMAVDEGTLALRGVPTAAVIRHAYLYWAIYGGPDDVTVALEGTSVTGAVIGRAGTTCWGEVESDYLFGATNVVVRADVTDLISGDGDYRVTGFPSFAPMADTQGLGLVVVYEDPGRDDAGTIVLRDGAAAVNETTAVSVTFGELPALTATGVFLHAGVGDAQAVYLDGYMGFGRVSVPEPDGIQHYAEREGAFWESLSYDLVALDTISDPLDEIGPTLRFTQEFGQDCVVFAYLALDVRSALPAAIDGGMPDGGTSMADGGSTSDGGGATDGGSTADGGIDAGSPRDASSAFDAAGPLVGSTGGCGCAVPRDDARPSPWWIALLATAVLVRRFGGARRPARRDAPPHV